MPEGPVTPPPAPESNIAAVVGGCVEWCSGFMWRKAGTEPPRESFTLIWRGSTTGTGLWAEVRGVVLGAWVREAEV